jgi:hypothetical protein
MNNNLLIAVTTIIILLASFWIFNHVNPWLGVAVTVIAASTAIVLIIKNLNKNE